jgi:hypothetical protein
LTLSSSPGRGHSSATTGSASLTQGASPRARLNRSEYSNTIRDLLGIDFRADRTFPTDDSGEGF